MVFLIKDSRSEGKVLLVKADDEDEVRERLCLDENVPILGKITKSELSVLESAAFAVIEA